MVRKESFLTYPQLIHSLITWGVPVSILFLLGYVTYLRYLFHKEFPSSALINRLRAEVDQFSGELADLTDRFSRFQKREGMRAARIEKTAQKDVQQEAADIIAAAKIQPERQEPEYQGPMANKLHLYRR